MKSILCVALAVLAAATPIVVRNDATQVARSPQFQPFKADESASYKRTPQFQPFKADEDAPYKRDPQFQPFKADEAGIGQY
ncbi:hypothetical protein X797_010326 [Metarhizium robertsii]|uniref:Uncharacterized protein n=2 Tax=Metarhizium robertsii TaxID=568076 RepID=E9FDR6_METRA|nr:uncharacterized protein MAA_10415 [Metarhizium robertsii ARSEF 23]EFY94131.1 hypothetical protein MAA_10415 [Metarhizium robertsii ARSEF 23]EXU96650.1 hypothetical protein X797_010326 [Metarhizium robertsii]